MSIHSTKAERNGNSIYWSSVRPTRIHPFLLGYAFSDTANEVTTQCVGHQAN